MKPKVTWVLVADGKRAQFFRNSGPGRGLVAMPELGAESGLPRLHELTTDRPARVQESANSARHAIEPKQDPRELLKLRFADRLARQLNAAIRDKRCHRFVLSGPPRFLGELRERLSPQARAVVVGEFPKDLTQRPIPEITAQVGTVLAV